MRLPTATLHAHHHRSVLRTRPALPETEAPPTRGAAPPPETGCPSNRAPPPETGRPLNRPLPPDRSTPQQGAAPPRDQAPLSWRPFPGGLGAPRPGARTGAPRYPGTPSPELGAPNPGRHLPRDPAAPATRAPPSRDWKSPPNPVPPLPETRQPAPSSPQGQAPLPAERGRARRQVAELPPSPLSARPARLCARPGPAPQLTCVGTEALVPETWRGGISRQDPTRAHQTGAQLC